MSKTTRFTKNTASARNGNLSEALVRRVATKDQEHTCYRCGKVLGKVGFMCDTKVSLSTVELFQCFTKERRVPPSPVIYLCWDCMVAASANWKRNRLGISGDVDVIDCECGVMCQCGRGSIVGAIDVSYPEVFDDVLSNYKRLIIERENCVYQLWGCRECMTEVRRNLELSIVEEVVKEKKLTLKYHQWSDIVENIEEYFLNERRETTVFVPPRGGLDGVVLCKTVKVLPEEVNHNLDLSLLSSALHSIQGVVSPDCGGLHHVADGSVVFHLHFNSILKLSRFLWAFCQRYGHIGRNSRTWHLSIGNVTAWCDSDTLMVTLTGKPDKGRIQQEDVDKLTCQVLRWLGDEKKPGGIAAYSENSKAAAVAFFNEHPGAETFNPHACQVADSESEDE